MWGPNFWGPNFSGTKFPRAQISQGPNFLGPKKLRGPNDFGAQLSDSRPGWYEGEKFQCLTGLNLKWNFHFFSIFKKGRKITVHQFFPMSDRSVCHKMICTVSDSHKAPHSTCNPNPEGGNFHSLAFFCL